MEFLMNLAKRKIMNCNAKEKLHIKGKSKKTYKLTLNTFSKFQIIFKTQSRAYETKKDFQ